MAKELGFVLQEDNPLPDGPCKGLVYRANISHYSELGKIGEIRRLTLLKKLSCLECGECSYIEELLSELDYPIPGIESCEHGKLYTISITWGQRDYYGDYDENEIELIPYIEKSEEVEG